VASLLTAAEFAHVLFGMMWVGTSIYTEVVLAPLLKRFKTTGEVLSFLPLFGRTSAFQMISGIMVIVTGSIYMLLKYQPLDTILTISSGQLVVLGLILVVVALMNGVVFLKPIAGQMQKVAWPKDPSVPIPDRVPPLFRSTGAHSTRSSS